MKPLLSSHIHGYAAAALLTGSALALMQLPQFASSSPELLLLFAIAISSRLAGIRAGLAATFLAVLAIKYLYISLPFSFLFENPNDILRLALFAGGGIAFSWIIATRDGFKYRATRTAERQSAIAKLADRALVDERLVLLLDEVSSILCQSFDVEPAGNWQAAPDGKFVFLAAGTGWANGVTRTSPTPREFPVTNILITLESSEAVQADTLGIAAIPNNVSANDFQSKISIPIQSDGRRFGTVGIFSKGINNFDSADFGFLQAFADLLGKAVVRIETETRIRKEREHFRNTLSSIGDGVIAVDSDGVVTLVNSAAERLTGKNSGDLFSRKLDDVFKIVDEKTDRPMANPAALSIQSGSIAKAATQAVLLTSEGRRVAIDANAAPMRDGLGRMTGSVLIFRDTTVARQIAEAIRQSEERLRVALKNSPVVVFNQDADLRYTWVHNPMRGFPDEAVLGKTDADLMQAADSRRWTEIKREVIESGSGARVEISATVDGNRRTFDLTIEPLRDQEGKISGVTCASIDITERKREQAAISRLAAIVESSEDAIIGKTLDGIILSWNPGAERLYGYDPDEIIGQSVSILYPPDRVAEFHQVTEQLKRGEPIPQHDTLRIGKNGNAINVSVSISLVRDNMGRVVGASSIARDITQRKRLQEENARLVQELQRANEELEQRVIQRTTELQSANHKLQDEISQRQRANEQLRQLSAHLQSAREEERTRVAREIHDELGQVLTVVKMDLALLERNLTETGSENSNDEIAAQLHATSQLVDDSIGKMREIIRELRPGILDHLGLKSAIEWQAQEFQAHTGIECQLETTDGEMPLDLDRSTAVFRIFQETLTNIARHAQATQVNVRLEKSDQLTLEVQDNGKGITEDEISDAKSFGILGMRERAIVFNGEVEVRGEEGHGTIVHVRIPLEKRND